jgi:hypothetical protein
MNKATKYVGGEPTVLQIDPHSTYRKYKEFAHRSHSTQLGQLSDLDSHFRSRRKKIATSSSVDQVGKLCLLSLSTGAYLNVFHLKKETETTLRNVLFKYIEHDD